MRAALKSAAVALLLSSATAFAAPAKVLVAPFAEANDSQRADWVDRSLQQSLADELTLNRATEVVDFKPGGNQSPEEQAKAQDAQYVVTGSVQRVAGEIRVSGRVDDVIAGKRVGSFKATGNERQLFAIEDSIAMQVKGLVGSSDSPTTTMAAGNNAPQLQTPFAPDNYGGGYEGSDLQRAMRNPNLIRDAAMNPPVYQDNTTYQQPLYPYTVGLNGNSPYGYGYGYNPYWYGSGWWWGGGSDVIVINNGGNGHGHDHGDHHHDGWRGNAGSWNGGGNWHGGGNSGGGGFTSVADTNGQAIRRAATWMGNAPSTMTHTMAGPQLVPGVSGAMNNVPRGGPQLVPSGSGAMNNVPRGGPQMVPGAAVTAGRGGGGGAAVSGGAGGRR